ncbi:ABC transporter permease [Neobacillus notoginsengisoli]|uniref:ABC transporter permease n=1 Tax=Neobacillus notoginsengisoli TaxID=1578198 RepID=A0A417YZF6_9BACI|nr:ABC transporter permease [Neobacillus notoginsengisoli]RHW43299.1 ABC transporter permease [Neobacillus notoginsengisoli]
MNGEGGDFLIWIILITVLFIVNYMAISFYNKKNTSFLWSGLLICILGPVIGFITGSTFVSMDHSAGGTGEGGAIGAAFIGLIILGNGIIYLLVGISLLIGNFFKR